VNGEQARNNSELSTAETMTPSVGYNFERKIHPRSTKQFALEASSTRPNSKHVHSPSWRWLSSRGDFNKTGIQNNIIHRRPWSSRLFSLHRARRSKKKYLKHTNSALSSATSKPKTKAVATLLFDIRNWRRDIGLSTSDLPRQPINRFASNFTFITDRKPSIVKKSIEQNPNDNKSLTAMNIEIQQATIENCNSRST